MFDRLTSASGSCPGMATSEAMFSRSRSLTATFLAATFLAATFLAAMFLAAMSPMARSTT